jgi:hypothetical protein
MNGPGLVALFGNTISGSQDVGAPGMVGSAGLYISEVASDAGLATLTIVGNVIHGGHGFGAVGIYAGGPLSMSLSSNAIDADAVDCNGVGVSVGGAGGGPVSVTANRIAAGNVCVMPSANPLSVGLLVHDTAAPTVVNNMIFGGIGGTMTSVAGSTTIALELQGVEAPVVQYNTLVGGDSERSIAVSLIDDTKGARIEENVLVGASGSTFDAGVGLASTTRCSDMTLGVGALRYNAFVNAPHLLRAGCPDASYETVRQLANELDASVDANVLVAAVCPDAGGPCAKVDACATPNSCLTHVFPGWINGVTNLTVATTSSSAFYDAGCAPMPGVGFTLGASTPCAISQGISSQEAIGGTGDLYGISCRAGSSYSLGADQNATACTP